MSRIQPLRLLLLGRLGIAIDRITYTLCHWLVLFLAYSSLSLMLLPKASNHDWFVPQPLFPRRELIQGHYLGRCRDQTMHHYHGSHQVSRNLSNPSKYHWLYLHRSVFRRTELLLRLMRYQLHHWRLLPFPPGSWLFLLVKMQPSLVQQRVDLVGHFLHQYCVFRWHPLTRWWSDLGPGLYLYQ